MLLYLSENHLTEASRALLENVGADTPVLLVQNAVYLYGRLVADYPQLSVTLLEEDAALRGISTEGKTIWNMADWTTKGAQFTPWVKL